MLAVYALTAGLLYFFWQADLHLLLGASLKGLVIGLRALPDHHRRDAAVFPAQAYRKTGRPRAVFQSLFHR